MQGPRQVRLVEQRARAKITTFSCTTLRPTWSLRPAEDDLNHARCVLYEPSLSVSASLALALPGCLVLRTNLFDFDLQAHH